MSGADGAAPCLGDRVDVLVFDWDGTLVDSERHIVQSMKAAAQQLGLPELSNDEVKNIIGLGMVEAIRQLYPELLDAQVQQFRRFYSGSFFRRGTAPADLFDGVRETLEGLRAQGFRLAVATGKSRNGLEKALDSTGLRALFDATRCADETRSKPHPLMLQELMSYFKCDAASMVMIGDTEYDLAMARSVGMPSVAVSYGVHEVARLLPYAPLKVIDTLAELNTMLTKR